MSDGTTKTITLTEDMLSSADLALLETVGTHTVTVNAMGQTVELSITLTETVEPMWVIYQLALASGTVDSTYEEWLDTIKGQDGKEVTFTVEDGWIKWKYQGDTTWNNLVNLSTLKGDSGADGKEVTFTVEDGWIKWKYQDDTTWNNLVNLSTLKGDSGVDGSEVTFRVEGSVLQWKYLEDTSWNDLFDFSTIGGESGKSAYETYKEHHPDYNKTEAEWLEDLVNGRLVNEYVTITFDPKGGTMPEDVDNTVQVLIGCTLELPVPTKVGYEFCGWVTGFNVNDGLFTNITPANRDLTLYAKWEVPVPKANLNYYRLNEIKVKDIVQNVVFDENGELYIPIDYAYRYDEEGFNVYININEIYEFEDSIQRVLFFNPYYGMVLQTSSGEYLGYLDNEFGQCGLGHTEELEDVIQPLFTTMIFNDNEELKYTYVFETYTVLITNQNRVFLTGSIYVNDELINNASTPIEITSEFSLSAGEEFLPQEFDSNFYFSESNHVINTNLRVFGLSSFFAFYFDDIENENLFFDLTELLQEGDSFVAAYYNTNGYYLLVTSFGYYCENQLSIQFPLEEGERIVTNCFLSAFTTNQGRVLVINWDDEDYEIEEIDIGIDANIIGFYPQGSLVDNKVYALIITEDDEYFMLEVTHKFETTLFELHNITSWFNALGEGKIIVNYQEYMSKIYYIVEDDVYYLTSDGFELFYSPVLIKDTIKQPLGKYFFERYENEKYIVIGWQDQDDYLDQSIELTEDIDIYPVFARMVFLEISTDSGTYYIEIIQGLSLSKEMILDVIEVPYGFEIDKVYYDSEEYDYQEPIYHYINLDVSFKKVPGHTVGVTYLYNNEIVGYQDIFVASGDALSHPQIELEFPAMYLFDGAYSESTLENDYDLNTIVTEDLIIYVNLKENVKRTLTLNLPYELDPIVLEFHKGKLVNKFQLVNRIVLDDYIIDNIYYNDEFSNEFFGEFLEEDLALYVDLSISKGVVVKYFDNNGLVGVKYLELNEGEIELYLSGYEVLGIYLDSDFNEGISFFDDPEITHLYVKVEKELGYTISLNLPDYSSLNGFIMDFRGTLFDLEYEVKQYLYDMTGEFGLEYALYSDSGFNNPYQPSSIDSNQEVFIRVEPLTMAILHLPTEGIKTLYVPSIPSFYWPSWVSISMSSQDDENDCWNLQLYLDEEHNNPYEYTMGAELPEQIELYIDYETVPRSQVELIIPAVNDSVYFYHSEYYLLYYNDIKYQLQKRGINPDLYQIEVYEDEDFTEVYEESFIDSDYRLYIKLDLVEYIEVTVVFPNTDFPEFVKKASFKSYFNDEWIHNHISKNIDELGYGVMFTLYTDSDFTTNYNYNLLDENIIIYVDLDITTYVNIYIHLPFEDEPQYSFSLENNIVLEEYDLVDYIVMCVPEEISDDFEIYFDPEFNDPYEATHITKPLHLFLEIQ